MLNKLKKDFLKLKNPKQAKILQSFFKTGKGQYGEGDIFLGIKVPEQRKLATKYKELESKYIEILLHSKIHEHRLTALFILINHYKTMKTKGFQGAELGSSTTKRKKPIIDLYLRNANNINNWDLVDLSAPNLLGDYLLNKKRNKLYSLAKSKSLWKKRIAIVATFTFIKNNQYEDTINIAEILLKDKHDLIHKAVGWMLREVGKRNIKTLENFLNKNIRQMPRTMLRYAIEKFPEKKRLYYLKK